MSFAVSQNLNSLVFGLTIQQDSSCTKTNIFPNLESFLKFQWPYLLRLIYEASTCGIVPNLWTLFSQSDNDNDKVTCVVQINATKCCIQG